MPIELTKTGESFRVLGEKLEAAEIRPDLMAWAQANGAVLLDANTGHPRRKMDARIAEELSRIVSDEGGVYYGHAQGKVETRDLAARFFRQHNEAPVAGAENFNLPLDASNVTITANGTEAFSALTQNVAGDGGVVGMPEGYYSAYELSIQHAGAKQAAIPATAKNNFYPTQQALLDFYETTPNLKMVYLPSGNPTGAPCTKAQAVEMANAINEITKRSDGSVLFVFDDAYLQLSKSQEPSIYTMLTPEAQYCTATIYTASKMLSLTSMAGILISPDKNLIRAMTGQRRVNALSSPTLGDPLLAKGLEILIHDHAQAMIQGEPATEFGLVGGLAQSYQKELGYIESGLKALEESYGLTPPIVDHPTEKALYCLGNFSAMLDKPLPDLPLAGGLYSLHEYLGTDRTRNDKDIKKLFEAMTFREPGAHGIDCRPGSIFGKEGYMRLTGTGSRMQHEKLLGVLKDVFDLLGFEQQKPFTYIQDVRKNERQNTQRELA